jgi:predicted ATP-grasp superfamily ATP-dependent carboligase
MGRAALEQSLKEQLARQGKGDFITFQELVDEAVKWKIIDKVSAKVVRDTAKKADKVLHVAPTDEAGALEVLDAVRQLLQLIYSAEGGF